MYLFCFFDLPVTKKKQRKAATQFRNFLLKDGYNMLQFSVYVRVLRDGPAVDKHLERLKNNLPREGSVRTLMVTEKQYGRMGIHVGNKYIHETPPGNQMLLI